MLIAASPLSKWVENFGSGYLLWCAVYRPPTLSGRDSKAAASYILMRTLAKGLQLYTPSLSMLCLKQPWVHRNINHCVALPAISRFTSYVNPYVPELPFLTVDLLKLCLEQSSTLTDFNQTGHQHRTEVWIAKKCRLVLLRCPHCSVDSTCLVASCEVLGLGGFFLTKEDKN